MKNSYLPDDLTPHYYYGLDLGQSRNHTALVTLEKKWKMGTVEEFIASANRGYHGEWVYRVVQADRVALNKSYTEIAHWVKDEIAKLWRPFHKTLVMDATGVGSAVRDLLRDIDVGASIVSVVITGGAAAGYTMNGNGVHVSRAELLTKMQTMVEGKRFSVSKDCRQAEALKREMMMIRLQGKPEKEQDDLAYATALAVWWGLK
jgi:hypothetical protein